MITTTLPAAGAAADPGISRPALWTGRVLSGITALFLLLDGAAKLLRLPPVVEGSAQLGYSAATILPLGVVLLVCVLAYLLPRTSVVGAMLLTGYLGGAVATHLRVGDPLLTHTLFPVYFGVAVWTGLLLRHPRLRELVFTPPNAR